MPTKPRTRQPRRPHAGPRRAWLGQAVLALIAVSVLVGGVVVVRRHLRARSLSGQVRRGLELLATADTSQRVLDALDAWERDTPTADPAGSDALVEHLLEECDLDDPRVPLLLQRLTGAHYGARRKDWQTWYESRERLRAGRQPAVARRAAVTLEPRWTAPVGLTGWFSTILPLDGQVYVASLGAHFDDATDMADGVVRVDGKSGAAELLFTPPPEHHGASDIIGLAAGDDCLFAACRNGFVYVIDPAGNLLWSTHTGSPIIGPPLAVDVNRDRTLDVIVATHAGKAVAMSGRRGTTIWVADVAQPRPGAAVAIGATLTLGNVLGGQGREIIVTTPRGDVAVLAVRDGSVHWRTTLGAGTLAGAIHRDLDVGAGPPIQLADRTAQMWSLVRSGGRLEAIPGPIAASRWGETVIAGLRSMQTAPDTPPITIVCSTGEYAGRRGGVCALQPEGLRWRFPIGGAVWGTPAIADLNGDGHSEIVATSIEPDAQGNVLGAVTIVSHVGQALHRRLIDAPVECSPTIADVDGDSLLEVLVADQSGVLHCFATRGYGPVEWGLLGGDSHNTRNAANAYAYGQVPCGLQWAWHAE